jgi:hypothetical protein
MYLVNTYPAGTAGFLPIAPHPPSGGWVRPCPRGFPPSTFERIRSEKSNPYVPFTARNGHLPCIFQGVKFYFSSLGKHFPSVTYDAPTMMPNRRFCRGSLWAKLSTWLIPIITFTLLSWAVVVVPLLNDKIEVAFFAKHAGEAPCIPSAMPASKPVDVINVYIYIKK